MQNDNYEFRILLFFHNIQKDNLYDTFSFTTLEKNPIAISDETNKVINVKLNKANNRGGIYYETAFLSNSKSKKSMSIFLTINCEIDNYINIDVNEEKGINLEIIEMWDIDYNEACKDERKIPDLKINEKEIQNYEKLFERKRWILINCKASSLSSNKIFSPETLLYLMDEKNIGKNYLYNIILSEDSTIYLLNEKKEKEKILNLEEQKKKEIKDLLDEINEKFITEFNTPFFFETPKFGIDIALAPIKNLHNKKFKEFKKIFNCYGPYWDFEKFSEKDLDLFISYSDLTINFSYFRSNFNYTFVNILKQYQLFKKNILQKCNLTYHEKARIISGFSTYCSHIINENFPIIPEFFMVEDLPNDDPYKISCQKFRTIITELKEYSCFFKKTLLFDNSSNEIINIWDYKEFKVRQLLMGNSIKEGYKFKDIGFNDFINSIEQVNAQRANIKVEDEEEEEEIIKLTFPKLSMLTLSQVKEHLLNLVPKFFFKVKNTNFSAVSNKNNFIIFINESNLLDIESLETIKSNKQKFVLPIMAEIIHENFNHLKARYEDNTCDSPLLNQIGLKNVLLCPNEFEPESGFLFEQLLIDSPSELIAIKTPNDELFELTDTKFWVQRTFKLFKEKAKAFAAKYNIKITKFKDSMDDSCYDRRNFSKNNLKYRCVFRKIK